MEKNAHLLNTKFFRDFGTHSRLFLLMVKKESIPVGTQASFLHQLQHSEVSLWSLCQQVMAIPTQRYFQLIDEM
jgi:hypothetical protein